MKSFVLLTFSIILSCFCAASAQTSSPKSVFQSWNEIQLIVPILRGKDAKEKSFDRLTAIFSGGARIGRKSFDFLDDRAGLTFDLRVSKHITLNAGTLYRRDENKLNVVNHESRLSTGVTFSTVFHKFTFKDRNNIEHRFRNRRPDLNVYRPRFQISRPLEYHEKEVFSPFISEEGYYDLTNHRWFRNEFYAGITRKFTPGTTLDIAYVRNDVKPVNVNGLSLVLKIKVR